MKTFWMYVLQCSDGSLYTGSTGELDRRVGDHQLGWVPATARLRPVALVYSEEFPTREDAKRREQQLKRWSASKKLALILGNFARLSSLARGHDRG